MKSPSPRSLGEGVAAAALCRSEWEDAGTVVILLSRDGTILDLNQPMVRVFGLPYEALKGSSVWEHVAPADRAPRQAVMKAVIETRKPQRFESEHDGRFYECVLRPCVGDDGQVVGISMAVQDITEQRHLLDSLSSTNRRLQVALGSANIGIWEHDWIVGRAWRSLEHARIFGYLDVSKPWSHEIFLSHVVPGDRALVEQKVQEGLESRNGWSFECRILRADGEMRWVWVTCSLTVTPDGRPLFSNGVVMDITARKRMEEERRLSEARFQTMFRASPIPAAMSRFDDGRYANVNDAFLRMYGYTREEVLGRTSAELGLWPERAERGELIRRLEAEGTVGGFEARFCTKSGDVGNCLISAALIEVAGQRHLFGMVLDITARKRVEEELREAGKVLEQMKEGVVLTRTSDGIIVFANPMFENMLGYGPGELVGRPVAIVNAPTDKTPEEIAAAIMEQLRATGSWEGEVANRRKDGGTIWCHATVSRFSHARFGEVWVSVLVDITAQRKAEVALRQANQRYDELAERISSGIYQFRLRTDGSARLEYASRRTGELLGVDVPTMLADATTWWRCAHPDEQAALDATVHRALKHTTEFYWEGRFLIEGQTRWRWLHGVPARQANGDVVWSGLITDVTPQKMAQNEIERQAALIQAMLDSMPDIVFYKNASGVYLGCNKRMSEALGRSKQAILGKTDFDLFPASAAEKFRLDDNLALNSSVPLHLEEPLVLPDGTRGVVDTLKTRLVGSTGEVYGILGVARDITERKRLDVAMREAEKMEAIGHVTGGMAHEFNNILASMMMSLSLLKMGNISSDARLMVEDLADSSHRAAGLIKQLLAFSGKSVMRVHALDWMECVANQCAALRALMPDRINLVFSTSGDLPQVSADRVMLEQVLRNLCLNARDAIGGQGGEVRVSLERVEIPIGLVPSQSEAAPGAFVCLTVSDNGCGMDDAIMKRLFEPFFTTRDVGQATGLGLATVRGIVRQHRGWVEVESGVGKGSTFRVFLPALEDAGREGRRQPAQVGSGLAGNGILVVEDDGWLRKHTARLLGQNGYVVFEAANADEAVEVWNRRGGEIDLLYSDVVMPGSMTGLQLAERLLAEKSGLRVVLTSGYNVDSTDLSRVLGASMTYLPKPCPVETILSTIHESLKRS